MSPLTPSCRVALRNPEGCCVWGFWGGVPADRSLTAVLWSSPNGPCCSPHSSRGAGACTRCRHRRRAFAFQHLITLPRRWRGGDGAALNTPPHSLAAIWFCLFTKRPPSIIRQPAGGWEGGEWAGGGKCVGGMHRASPAASGTLCLLFLFKIFSAESQINYE